MALPISCISSTIFPPLSKEKAPEFLFECFRFSGQQYIFCQINSNSHFSFSCNSFDKYSHPGREHHSSPRSFFNNIAPHLGHLLLQNSPSCLVIVSLPSFRLPIFPLYSHFLFFCRIFYGDVR